VRKSLGLLIREDKGSEKTILLECICPVFLEGLSRRCKIITPRNIYLLEVITWFSEAINRELQFIC
jgi:hypothetical protein